MTVSDNDLLSNTLMEWLGIEFLVATKDLVTARMPVDHRTKQPQGMLHGGASLALAETVASFGSYLNIDMNEYVAFGLEINGNHIRPAKSGFVTAAATPIHRGRTTHVWDVRITDEAGHLVNISRCTVAIVKR